MPSCIAELLRETVTLPACVKKPEWAVSWSNTPACNLYVDREDCLRFAETSLYPNWPVGFNTKMAAFFRNLSLSGSGAIRYMFFYAFTCSLCVHANPIARVRRPE